MPNESTKTGVGRQSQLPFRRALDISVKSLRIRFWRSIITAGGIFLGIAFLTTVFTQRLMQWPVPEKVEAGHVRVEGQIKGPGDYEVWRPIPVEEGLKAGIPAEVVETVANGRPVFSLAAIVQGKIQAARADKNLARVNKEWVGLRKLEKPVAFWLDVKDDKEIKIDDAVKMGVPRDVARKLAGKEKFLMGSALTAVIREQPRWITPFYAAVALDQDITLKDGVRAGVPEAIARHLIGDGKSFKGGALNEAIKTHPNWMKIWRVRANRYAVFKTVDDAAVKRLEGPYSLTLGEVIKSAKGFGDDAHKANVMIVNEGGRKVRADFDRSKDEAAALLLRAGDNILIPDLNSYYRMIWLVVMSLLVCTVGITNSMLMSVTERFKEIGTMKCLGALDKFVVTLFMLESGMMGIVASIFGWAVGFFLMVLIAGSSRGWDLVANIALVDVVKMFFTAIGVGLTLTIIATIAPAQRAARMPAAMALRSEI